MKTPKKILERRRSVRITESLPFTIGHEGYEIEAQTLNISAHGAMCEIERDIPLMTQLQIGIKLGRTTVKTKGVVVRKEKNKLLGTYLIAVFFSGIAAGEQEKLDKFIEGRTKP